MAFGQASGPPAPARDVARLAELVERAGFSSFKEARHPLGLTQRQAGGKFTRDEVDELVARLEAELDGGGTAGPEPAPSPPRTTRSGTTSGGSATPRRQQQRSLAAVADEVLVAELELRGWSCIPPT